MTNLQDRLLSLEASGLKREEALRKIQIEFSDINKVADQMSLAKKKEIFELQYMSLRNFVTKPRAAIYTILGAFTAFILVLAGLSYLGTYEFQKLTGVLLLLLSLPLAGFVYTGLTQETATRYPMQPVRALSYATSVFLFLFGILLVPMLVFREAKALKSILTILVPFVLPSIGVISFLLITETDQRKA